MVCCSVDLLARSWTAEDLTNAVIARKAVCNKMWRFMADYDLLLTPTLTVPPFPVHTQGPEIVDGRMVPSFQWLSFTLPINMTGQPAASVPAGLDHRRAPGRTTDRRTPPRDSGSPESGSLASIGPR